MAEEKILKDELMSDAELDNVAGGNVGELAKMTQLFATLGFLDKSYAPAEINSGNIQEITDKVSGVFGELGMGMNFNKYRSSAYTAAGDTSDSPTNVLTHNQAVDEVIKRAGRSGDVNGAAFYIG